MKKILFPIDFSKASLNAFVYAVNLAKRIGAEIITLHVYDIPISGVNDYYPDILENYDIVEWSNFENYKSEVPKLRAIAQKNHCHHVKLSHVLEKGDTVDTILQVAHHNKVDFIVMGTNGASGIKEGIFGTVTEKVMNRSKCIVLAIPSSCEFTPLSKILFLTQFEKRHRATLHQLVGFAKMFAVHIDVLHVTAHHSDDETKTLRAWRKEFSEQDVSFQIIGSDDVEETITDFMKLHHNNLLAMTVKRKGLLDRLLFYSIASKMVFHSEIPVLSIRYE